MSDEAAGDDKAGGSPGTSSPVPDSTGGDNSTAASDTAVVTSEEGRGEGSKHAGAQEDPNQLADLSGLPVLQRWARKGIRSVLPRSQRRSLAEMHHELDLGDGDRRSKVTAFWSMLILSGIIASAGVLGDSTATVIGAMIIAPLSTPIMGIALGIATSSANTALRSAWFVVRGMIAVIVTGVIFSWLFLEDFLIQNNSQIADRTSPGLLDLVAAIGTGFAGAIALSRRDVAAVLPGVAISISLVPPLAVIGLCLGRGAFTAALGASLLFLSNALALILAGSIVFAAMRLVARSPDAIPQRAMRAIGVLFLIVGIPLVANSVANYFLSILNSRAAEVTNEWLDGVDGAFVEDVDLSGTDLRIAVTARDNLPDTDDLLADLDDALPNGLAVVLEINVGQEVQIGTTGEQPDSDPSSSDSNSPTGEG